MAGLVGVLRQLGDLAEFAAEIFRELHEEVMATAARGHGLMVRVQQLEAEFPSIEKAFFSQTSHSHFAHNAGIDWHANLHIDQNLITRGDMPRFILDSYEECRGPPRLFMLDKFDIAGAGTCLKRYSDPSFFKMELASSGTMESEVQREKKVRKIKKKVSHWKNDEVEFSLAPRINSNLQPEIPEQAPETKPTRRVKLKSRHLTAMDTSSRRSYMESLLEVHSAEQEVQLENSLSQTNIKMESIKSAPEVHEILVDNLDKYPSFSEKKPTQPPTKQITEAPTNGLENQKIKGEEILEILPQSFEGVQKMYIDYQVVVKKETSAESENKTERSAISYRSSDAENYTPALLVSQNTLLDDVQCITEDFAEVFRPDDIGSEADSFMDALNIMESEIETDSESRAKSDAGLFSMESQVAPFNNNSGQQELLAHFSGPDPVENSIAQLGLENIQDEGMPSVSISNKLGNLDDTQPSLQKMIGFDVNANSEACPGDTQDTSSEKLWGNGEAMKLKSQVNLLSDGTCHDKASAIRNSSSEIGEASSDSCVSDLTCAIIHLCPEGSFDQAQLVTSDSNEISFCDVKCDDKGAGHLDGNAPCAAETSEASQLNGSPLRSRYLSGETHHPEHVEELVSEDIAVVVDTPNPIFPMKGGQILEQLTTGYVDDTEGCSGGIISRTASSCYPEISSTIGPDGLAAETKSVMQPEDLAGEISPGCVTGIYEVVEYLDGNAPCAAETSEASQLNGSLLRSRYLSKETHHPPEHVEELISEDIAVVVDVPKPIFAKKDGHILELPTDYVDDTEGCSGGIISRTASSHYPEISSTVVGPDDLAAKMENVMQPEDLAAEISPGFVTGIYEVAEHLDGLHTGGIAVHKKAFPSEDDRELNSSQTQSTTLLEEPSPGYIEDLPRSLTLQLGREPQELIEGDTKYISPVTSHITMQPAGLAVETENSVAPDEELECSQSAGGLPNTEEIVESEILLPHILPLDVEPREFRDAESAEFAPSFSGKETVPDDVQLQSNSEVIDEPVPVGDYLRLSFEYTDLHSDALQIEQHIQCDDSLIKSVTDEAVIDYHETSSQEDCVPGDTDLNQYNFDITEPSSPNNRTESYSERALCTPLSPRDESLPISASAVSSSEFFNQDLSDSSDARLFNGICHTMPSEHPETDLSLRVVEEIPFYSLETGEDFSSRASNESVKEGISSSLEEAPKAHAGDESNEMSSYQEGEHLEPSDLLFEITQSVDQDIIQSNSVESSDLGSEADSHIMVIDQNISELDIRSSNTWQLEPEAAAPSEFSYEQSVIPSLNSSAAGLPLFASFGLAISESTPEQFSETQISDTASSFQLQDLHETPPLPPLPPLEWRLVKARPGCLTSDGNLVQPLAGTNPFTGVSVEAEIVAPLPPLKDNRSQCGSLGLHNEKVWPLRLSELPPIVEDERHQHCIQEEAVLSTDPSVLVSPIEDDKHLHSHWQPSNPFLPLQSPEDGVSRHFHRLPVEKIQPSEDKGPQLVQLPPSLEVERSPRGNLTIEREIMQSTSPFFTESSVEDEMYRNNYGAYGAENMQHLNWSGPMMQHHGLISSVDENPFSPYDDSVPSSGDEKPNGKLRSIRNLPRHPLIDAVAAHDKSKLRKVSELVQPSTRPKADERDTLLEQIRNKCFNLKPAAATRPNIKGPPTNLKVAAILEKANAIRQACVGSDEEDDNGDGWSDS